MAKDNKIRRPVSFNKTKKLDNDMMKFLGRRNFSGYVKKLIREDMERKAREVVQVESCEMGVEEVKGEPTPVNESVQESVQVEKGTLEGTVSESVADRLVRIKKELANQQESQPKVFINNHLKK